jgi:arylsulfatase A-like enzyme
MGEKADTSPAVKRQTEATFLAVCLIGACFGLASGWTNVAVVAVRKLVFGHFIRRGVRFAWIGPAAELVLFLLGAVALVALTWRCQPRVRIRISVIVLAAAACLGVLSDIKVVHPIALSLLSLGFGVQVWRMIAVDLTRSFVVLRRATTLMLLLLLAAFTAVEVQRRASERKAWAALPAAAPGAPNVLLIVLDCVRADHLGAYGYHRPTTPNIDRLTSRGVLFENAIATAPWTLPSHASMFTGKLPQELGTNWLAPLEDRHLTLAEHVGRHGYANAGFVANVLYGTRQTGLAQGFHHYEDYPLNLRRFGQASWLGRTFDRSHNVRRAVGYPEMLNRKPAASVTSACLAWLDANKGKPFFAFLNYFDAHVPYLPPPPFDAKFGPPSRRAYPWLLDPLSQEQRQAEIDAYDGAIAYVDQQVGRLLDELSARGILDDTLVIITSDHGEQLGEHGLWEHGNSLYRQLLHVPLILHFGQRLPAGTRVKATVSLRDIPATVADLLQTPPDFPGQSLLRYVSTVQGREPAEVPAYSEVRKGIRQPAYMPISRGDMRSLVADGMHYIRNGDGIEELYDFRSDRAELANLAADPRARQTLLRLRAQADAIPARTPNASGPAAPATPRARLALAPQRGAPTDREKYRTSGRELLFDANRN